MFSFRQDEEEDIELPFTEDEIKEKYDGKLEQNMKGPTFEVKVGGTVGKIYIFLTSISSCRSCPS